MKRLPILFVLLFSLAVSAQNISITDINSDELKDVIAKQFNIEIEKYDLSSYLNGKYTFTIYIDEYYHDSNDSLVKERINNVHMGQNIKFVEDAEFQDYLKGKPNFNEESNELTQIESLTLATRIDSKSTALLSFTLMPSGAGGSIPLKVMPPDGYKKQQPLYSSRPFKFDGDGNKTGEIPLYLT